MSKIKINLVKLQNVINFIILTLKNKLRYFSVYFYYKTNIERIVRYKDQIIYIVCDNRISNPTYGDFLYFAYLSRYFVLKGIEVKFIFLEDDNKEWKKYLPDKEIRNFKKEQIILINNIGKIKKKNIYFSTYKDLLKIKSNKHKIIFKDKVFSNIQIFDRLLDFLNIVMSYENKKFLQKFLLNKKEFSTPKKILKIKPYISWHLRYNKKWGNYNNSKPEVKLIFNKLNSRFKNKKIIIISDRDGCNFAKKILKKNKNIYYSKDVTTNFFEDMILLVNSDFYFQYKAGGIYNVALFSTVPYKVIAFPSPFNEAWNKEKFVSWQLKTQLRERKNITLNKV